MSTEFSPDEAAPPAPVEATAAEETPVEPTLVEPTPVEPTPVEAVPEEALLEEAVPEEQMPAQPMPVEAITAQPMPTEPLTAQPMPVEAIPVFPMPPTMPPPQSAQSALTALRNRRGLFVAGWLASALAVGTGAGFAILAAIGPSKDSVTAAPNLAASPTAASPSPSVTSGVRPDGTHYGSVKDFLLPMPDGFKPGPDEGDFGNDSTIPADQADPTVELLFGKLPASDMTTAQGALTAGHMSDGAVRTYSNQAGTLDVSVTVLLLDPAQSAESTSQFERVVKQSRAFRTGPMVPGHPDALCVLPVTHVGDTLDGMVCLGTVGDTFAIVRAEGTVPLDTAAVTGLFGRQLDKLKGGLGT